MTFDESINFAITLACDFFYRASYREDNLLFGLRKESCTLLSWANSDKGEQAPQVVDFTGLKINPYNYSRSPILPTVTPVCFVFICIVEARKKRRFTWHP